MPSMLNEVTETLNSGSGVITSGADALLVPLNSERSGLAVAVDPAGVGNVYLLLRPGVASAANWDIPLAPGGSWAGTIGNVLWRGSVRVFGTGAKVSMLET